MHRETATRRFRLLAIASLVCLYLLFVIGALVRASGAGMGCPDWPQCFGQWIPPTDITQLPDNYQTIYADRGYKEVGFNAIKTWTEYLNRLTSALLGILVLATAVASLFVRHLYARVGAIGALVGVLVNAWMGSVIVQSNLHPAIITTHLLFSIITLGFLLFAVMSVEHERWLLPKQYAKKLLLLSALLVCALIIQVALGTQLRESVETFATAGASSLLAIPEIARIMAPHAMWGMLVFTATIALCFLLASNSWYYINKTRHQILALIGMLAVSVNLLLGVLLSSGDFIWAKPLHLLMAVIALGAMLTLSIISARSLGVKLTNKTQYVPTNRHG